MSLDTSGQGFVVAEDDSLPQPRNHHHDRARNSLVVALDKASVDDARDLVRELGDRVDIYKVGLELALSRDGLEFAKELQMSMGKRIFLDMKFLDIPNTVQKAVANVARMGFEFLTVHAHDTKTMEAAVRGRDDADSRSPRDRLKLLGVTVLTSYDHADLQEQGHEETSLQLAVRRAVMACKAGFDGVIASGHEIEPIRKATFDLKQDFIIKVPGIRPAESQVGDQSRVMTPFEALSKGATYLVIGRPISEAPCVVEATRRIKAEMEQALIHRARA